MQDDVALDGKQRRFLRGLSHGFKPVVQIGHRGATEAVVREVDRALIAHELIKVKIGNNSDADSAAVSAQLCEALGCQQVQAIGGVLLLFRQPADPEERTIELP